MQLWYFRGLHPNFGDELNPWLWSRLLPQVVRDTAQPETPLFLAIGSILTTRFQPCRPKFVFGSGFGGFSAPPQVHDGSWTIRFVRGPQTARLLGLDQALAIADPAVLLAPFAPRRAPVSGRVGFVPHWESMERGRWQRACAMAGVTLIDPRWPVDTVLDAIAGCEKVIAEAMHGAIVADVMRVPWIAVSPLDPRQRLKWHDWAGSLEFTLRPRRLVPSTWAEAHLSMPSFRLGRGAVRVLRAAPGGSSLEMALTDMAAVGLASLARAEPMLSQQAILDRATERVDAELLKLQRELAPRATVYAA